MVRLRILEYPWMLRDHYLSATAVGKARHGRLFWRLHAGWVEESVWARGWQFTTMSQRTSYRALGVVMCPDGAGSWCSRHLYHLTIDHIM